MLLTRHVTITWCKMFYLNKFPMIYHENEMCYEYEISYKDET